MQRIQFLVARCSLIPPLFQLSFAPGVNRAVGGGISGFFGIFKEVAAPFGAVVIRVCITVVFGRLPAGLGDAFLMNAEVAFAIRSISSFLFVFSRRRRKPFLLICSVRTQALVLFSLLFCLDILQHLKNYARAGMARKDFQEKRPLKEDSGNQKGKGSSQTDVNCLCLFSILFRVNARHSFGLICRPSPGFSHRLRC